MNIKTIIGNNIRKFRERLGVSQENFADIAGVHRTYISGVERGEYNITAETLLKIAKGLKVEPFLLFIEDAHKVEDDLKKVISSRKK